MTQVSSGRSAGKSDRVRYQNRRASTPFSFFTDISRRRFSVPPPPTPYATRQLDRRPRPRFFGPRPKMEVDYCRDRQNGHREKKLKGMVDKEAAELS